MILEDKEADRYHPETLERAQRENEIHLQWVPSHVNIAGNEIADALAKDGAAQPSMNSTPPTYSELHSPYINNKRAIVHSCSSLCRFKLISGPGRRRSTDPIALADQNLLPENLVKSSLSGPFHALLDPGPLCALPKPAMDKLALVWFI
ncbi:hypothetical protein TNCV_2582301 [Trichonephila clavipes]|nr:hypothetical protein TNCV_2582301 [Trichonephila clavipes]